MSRRRAAGSLAAVFVALGLANFLAGRMATSWDLTAQRSASLSEQTLRVLGSLDRDVEVTAFFSRDEVGRVEAATLLSRYRKASRRVEWTIVDPVTHPGEVERTGVQQPGSAAVESGGRIEIAQFVIEIDITSAIARLLRQASGRLCFTTGHGERAIDDDTTEGLSQAAGTLRNNGYETVVIDLLASPVIPEGCEAVVVADPTSDLSDEAVAALDTYAVDAGKLWLLSDPDSRADLTVLGGRWGIVFERGIVIERDAASRLPDDPVSPIVRRYDRTSPIVRGLGPTYFPGAQAIVIEVPGDRPDLAAGSVAVTSETAYLERNPGDGSVDPDDLTGPLGMIATADSSEVVDPTGDAEIVRTRVLATADVDFASNGFVGEAANARLVVQSADWLTQPEPLITAVPSFPELRELELTEARSRYILVLTAGIVPGLFVLAGGFVWVLRRGR